MSKINIGLILLIVSIMLISSALVKMNGTDTYIKDQLDLINAKLDDLDDDIHELNK